MAAAAKLAGIPFYKLVASALIWRAPSGARLDAFTAPDLTTLMRLCDENVVVATVRRQDHYCGKAAVAAFFANQFRSEPSDTRSISSAEANGWLVSTLWGSSDLLIHQP